MNHSRRPNGTRGVHRALWGFGGSPALVAVRADGTPLQIGFPRNAVEQARLEAHFWVLLDEFDPPSPSGLFLL